MIDLFILCSGNIKRVDSTPVVYFVSKKYLIPKVDDGTLTGRQVIDFEDFVDCTLSFLKSSWSDF